MIKAPPGIGRAYSGLTLYVYVVRLSTFSFSKHLGNDIVADARSRNCVFERRYVSSKRQAEVPVSWIYGDHLVA